MVRTKADMAGFKAVGAKASRKSVATPVRSTNISTDTKGASLGGNSYHPRETPQWQKPITSFFGNKSEEPKETGSSSNQEPVEETN